MIGAPLGLGARIYDAPPLFFRSSFFADLVNDPSGVMVRAAGDARPLRRSFSDVVTFTRASTATFFNSAGVLTTAAANAPRFDHHPVTRQPRGLLMEEQRANLFLRSEEFNNAAWVKEGATVSANAASAPNSIVAADKLVEDASTGVHRVIVAPVLTLAPHTMSVYAKAVERNWIAFGNASDGQRAFFDVLNGVIGNVTGGASASITPVGNGWFRCTVTFTPTATSRSLDILLATSGSTATYAGVAGSGLLVWGAQLEAGAFATSYIPTVAAPVTRSADLAIINGSDLSDWFVSAQGTFVFEGQGGRESTQGGFGRFIAYDGTRAFLARDGGASVTFFNGVTAVTKSGLPADPANSIFKGAAAWDATGVSVTAAGLVVVQQSATVVVPPTVISLGSNPSSGNSNNLNGHIRAIRYWPERLTNAQLQGLTA